MTFNLSNPIELLVILAALTMLPFLAVMVTSFTKIIIVLGLLRNALGLQTTPPNIILNGIAIILSAYIMHPVLLDTGKLVQEEGFQDVSMETLPAKLEKISLPICTFLKANSTADSRLFFIKSARQLWPQAIADKATEDDFVILLPAFVVTEISAAFQIGFIIYMPFIIIDLVVSNILMALGIIMIAPTSISLPFKLLLFCLINGWTRLLDGLMLTYTLPH
jgi:type III secretion protein R